MSYNTEVEKKFKLKITEPRKNPVKGTWETYTHFEGSFTEVEMKTLKRQINIELKLEKRDK